MYSDFIEDAANIMPDSTVSMLVSMYSSSDRYHHGLSHIVDLVKKCKLCSDIVWDMDSLILACWFHDVVYNPKTPDSDNVTHSARLINNNNLPNKTESDLRWIRSLVFCTDHSIFNINSLPKLTSTNRQFIDDATVLVDADLSVLGENWDLYTSYMKSIRCEYSFVDETTYRQKRTFVLKSFLKRKRLFRNPLFYSIYENQARMNMEKEISMLKDV